MKNVESPEELRKELKNSLKNFMKNNEKFHIQGRWTGSDGVTVSVLIDFGIEDHESGDYYMGMASARYDQNHSFEDVEITGIEYKELDCDPEQEEEYRQKLMESQTLLDAENAIRAAVRSVFDIYHIGECMPEESDIDVSVSIPIMFGEWDVRHDIMVMDLDESQREQYRHYRETGWSQVGARRKVKNMD